MNQWLGIAILLPKVHDVITDIGVKKISGGKVLLGHLKFYAAHNINWNYI